MPVAWYPNDNDMQLLFFSTSIHELIFVLLHENSWCVSQQFFTDGIKMVKGKFEIAP